MMNLHLLNKVAIKNRILCPLDCRAKQSPLGENTVAYERGNGCRRKKIHYRSLRRDKIILL